MKNTKVTLNQDGTPRKSGSGRKKGSNSFVKINFEQLKEFIGEKTPIMVSRVWLENIGFSTQNEFEPKIQLTKENETDSVLYSVKTFED